MKTAAQGPTYRIGRARDCDIVVAHDSVSRYHAELSYLEGGKLYLTDCHSINGTAIVTAGDEISVRQNFVSPTETVRFGDVFLPVKEILEAIRLRSPAPAPTAAEAVHGTTVNPAAEEEPAARSEWVRGPRLIRCRCGEVRQAETPCPACGDSR